MKAKRIAIVTSGGDAPGMNAAIRAVVRTAIFNGLEVVGIERGYQGLIEGQIVNLSLRSVSGIINRGGTILKTVRCEEIKTAKGMTKAVKVLENNKVDYLAVIGGNGSFNGAWQIYQASGKKVKVIGIPASIDNDVAGTDETVGFDTATNTAVEAIDKIRDTATSHERVFVVEVMGRDRGFLALQVGLASGAEFILVPEVKYDLIKMCSSISNGHKHGKTSYIIVMAEGAGNSQAICDQIHDCARLEVRFSNLGYIQRGGSPTARSRILAEKFGEKSVELILKGEKTKIVGIKDNKISASSLDYAWKGTKELDKKMYKLAEILAI
ncbi:MAG: 6-phosphofructokinase [Elusimicrobia bacterium]|nr:6-phosphofructokinase [Elusimicrobiota bacterium]